MMDIIAEKMVYGGECITHIDGKTVFVPGILPGEKAEIAITESKKDWSRARVLNIQAPSPHRRAPPCPFFGRCGGCNLQYADDAYQRELRLSILKDTFLRGFGRKFSGNAETASRHAASIQAVQDARELHGESWGYRSRFQFHHGGLMAARSAEVVPVTECPVATESVNALLKSGGIPAGERVHVYESSVAGEERLADGAPPTYTETVCGKKITFKVRGFFQSNHGMLEKTVRLLSEVVEKNRHPEVLDLYSGVGTFTACLGGHFETAHLVEHDKDALALAQKNCPPSLPVTLYPMSGERFVSELKKHPKKLNPADTTVVVDPPRTGMEKAVSRWLCEEKPPLVLSVSCDPVTHARDVKALVEAGYTLKTLTLLDFYPQTGHIESFAELAHE